MKPRIIILSSIVLAAGALASCSSSSATLETVAPETAAQVIVDNPDAVVLDIRTPEEFAAGFIEGAINIDFYASDFTAQLDQLDKGT